ncbi:MAG TPA: hypothetical protein PK438_00860 [Clostridia bacterium]|nr:MAG: hypothetical protein BWY35_01642 [Firmicutes bacterium ADurb.Bin248]HOG00494.1 hypothetical protein [Clostridia bacterium]HOS17810.1 hypothetical protein [Clostridia bacterium]HPK14837.1 hypothetical protein [Clostridia bacterium]
MVVAIFGESCTGKSTLADKLKQTLGAAVYSGKDYLRLAKTEPEARAAFSQMLRETQVPVIFVAAEKELLGLIPDNAVRVLATADLALIRERFAKRTGGRLPPPVAAMLEKKHGCFDIEPHDIRFVSGESDPEETCAQIARLLASR